MAAARGSLKAYLAWLGMLVYSTYSYVLYAGFVYFGPLLLVYVAVLGLSAYTLVAGFNVLDPVRVRDAFEAKTSIGLVAAYLLLVGALYYVLDISIIVGATRAGRPCKPPWTPGCRWTLFWY